MITVQNRQGYKNVLQLLLGALAGAILTLSVVWDSELKAVISVLGANIGFAVIWVYHRVREKTLKMQKLRGLAAIYEALVYYTRAGHNLRESLRLAGFLTPTLRPDIEHCVRRWLNGPEKAVQEFAERVNIPEAQVLAGLLVHCIDSGMDFGESAMQAEAKSLEDIRRTLVEVKIASKPVYYAMYRALPLVAISGIIIGALGYRAINMLSAITALH